MIRGIYTIVGLAFIAVFTAAQHKVKDVALTLPNETLAFAVDIQDNIYVIDNKLNLIKRNAAGDTIRMISALNQGSEPIIDASNPLEIFVYFTTTGRVVWYDNQLNPGGSLDLFAAGLNNIGGFGRANDGNIWVFDNNKGILKKLNREGNLLEQSLMLQGQSAATSIILDNGKEILVSCSEGLHVLSNNLVLLRTVSRTRTPLGWSQDNIVSCDSLCVYQSQGVSVLREDTLLCVEKPKKILGGNPVIVGVEDERGIHLHSVKKN